MSWYYAVGYHPDNREEIRKCLVNNSLRLLSELRKKSDAARSQVIGTGIVAERCFGPWLDSALAQLLCVDNVGQTCHYLALRDDGRILDAEFVAEVMPALFKARII